MGTTHFGTLSFVNIESGATMEELSRATDLSGRIVNVTSATVTITEAAHEGRTVVLDRAAGIAVTLPAASGSGGRYRFVLKTTVTSNATTIKVVGNDVMAGLALLSQDSADTTVVFETAADTDTVSFNGSTTGGIAGAIVELEDIAADTWCVRVSSAATGTEATPFAASVS